MKIEIMRVLNSCIIFIKSQSLSAEAALCQMGKT